MAFATRFAPSPTGLLHRGHAWSALTAWRAARSAGGRFVLRIEDADFTRCRPEFEAAVFEDLAWLGLDWDEVSRQSERRAAYGAAVEQLRERGLLYRCFRTRREIAALAGVAPNAGDPADPQALAIGPHAPAEEAALLAQGRAFAWRLSLAAAREALGGFEGLTWVEEGVEPGLRRAAPERLGDMVVGRKDIGAGYVVASVMDDGREGISHVIRGVDLEPVTSMQRVLQALLGLPTPIYRHHGLILNADGRRLAKRDGAESLRGLREAGVSPKTVIADLEAAAAGRS